MLGPQLLKIIETSDLGSEDMHDHLAGIDQHPIAMRHALDPKIALAGRLELLDKVVGDGAHMPVGPAGSDHHAVGNGGLPLKIDGDDIFGLRVIELGQDCGENRVGDLALRRKISPRRMLRRAALLYWCCQVGGPFSKGSASSRLRQFP